MPGRPAQDPEKNAMLAFFLDGHTQAEVAREFNRDPHTVSAIAHSEDWEGKKQKAKELAAMKLIKSKASRMARTIEALLWRREVLMKEIVADYKASNERSPFPTAEKWEKVLEIERELRAVDAGVAYDPEGVMAGGIQITGSQVIIQQMVEKMDPAQLKAEEDRVRALLAIPEEEASDGDTDGSDGDVSGLREAGQEG